MQLPAPWRTCSTVVLVLLLALPLFASSATGTATFEEGIRSGDDIVGPVDPSLFEALRYRMIGPHKGSRSTAVAGVRTRPRTFYFGGTGGGVWKSTDAGEIWRNVSDGQLATGAVGSIAVADSDPNVVYVGTGSADIRGNVTPGVGIYKSTDAGETWHHVGLEDAGQIGRIVVAPGDPDRVFAAVLGNAFGPNETRGVYRSLDGGDTWERVLFVNDRTGAVELSMDATNPRILFAAMWTAERKPWTMRSGSEESGLYRSVDGGDTWTELTDGLPDGLVGKIGVSVSPADPDRVWALVEAEEGGLFRSDDGGDTWRLINDDRELQNRPWYYMHVFADPADENTVWVASRYFHKSVDGGRSFQRLQMPHGDNHDLWINPDRPAVMIQGNDGGAGVSTNGGESWSTQLNQPTAEMYKVDVDEQFPYRVYGSQQDTYGVLSVPSRSANFGAKLQVQYWDMVGGMEGGVAVVRPDDPDIVYAGSTSGGISRYDRSTGQIRPIKTYPEGGGMPAKYLKYRFQRTAPIRLSPHDPDILYHASQYVHRSTDGGQSWEVISPDLTTDDESKQSTWGGPISREVTSEEVYCTIFAFDESPLEQGVLWAGSDDGLVHVSRDDGATWSDVTPDAMPEWGTVNSIDLSVHEPGKAIIAVLRYRLDDTRPYVFRTTDYGESWTQLTPGDNGIPADRYVRVVREDPDREGLLYAGTDFGIYVSFDDGAHWQPLQLDLPVTPITDIEVHRKDLVLSTQGRSFWILDDLSPLHQIDDEVATADAWLFEPRDAHRVRTSIAEADSPYVGGYEEVSNLRDLLGGARIERNRMGTEAPEGAILYTWFRERPEGEVTLEILDEEGDLVRSFSSLDPDPHRSLEAKPEPPWRMPADEFWNAGQNRFVWDLRYPGPRVLEDGELTSRGTMGPEVVPGTYRVRLTAGDWSQTRTLRVLPDPRLDTTTAEYEAQLELLFEIRDAITEAHAAVAAIRGVRERAAAVVELLGEASIDRVRPAYEALLEALAPVERALTSVPADLEPGNLDFPPKITSELGRLYGYVESPDAPPTEGATVRHRDLRGALDEQLASLRTALEDELATFNATVREAGTEPVPVPDLESIGDER